MTDPLLAPGGVAALVITFTPGDELDVTKTNLGVVTLILPGFTGGNDNGLTTSGDLGDDFASASYTRAGEISVLQLTADTRALAFGGELAVTVPSTMGIKLPADGITANQASIKLSIGAYQGSGVHWSESFSAATIAVQPALIAGVRINSLASKGSAASGTVATVPKFSSVEISVNEEPVAGVRRDITASILAGGDSISIRQGNSAWGCFATRADSASSTRSANVGLTLQSGIYHGSEALDVGNLISANGTIDTSGLGTATATGTTYTMCFAGDDVLTLTPSSGIDAETGITIEVQSKVHSIQLNSNGNDFSNLYQSPRNDFTIKVTGDTIAAGNSISLIPDASSCSAAMATAQAVNPADTTATFFGEVDLDSNGVGSFTWAECLPKADTIPMVLDGDKCPTAGLYRLCYDNTGEEGDATKIETGVSLWVFKTSNLTLVEAKQVSSPTWTGTAQANQTFGVDFVHEVFEPFTITVQLADGNNNACCEGTRLYMSLTKAGADHSEYLYNAAGSNTNADKQVYADANGVATFTGYTIRRTAGKHYFLTISTPDLHINIPNVADDSSDTGFIVRPTSLSITTDLESQEYIVGASEATLPDFTVLAKDRYGTTLTGLVTADDYHCELQLQTGSDGLDSSDNTAWGGVGGLVTSADFTADTVVFDAGSVTFTPVKVAKTAGRYFRLKAFVTEHAGSTGAGVVGTPVRASTSSTDDIVQTTSLVTQAFSGVFMISPAKMKVAWGVDTTDYAADTFPFVIKLDGEAGTYPTADAPDTDGLPSTMHVLLLDAAGGVLTSTNCSKCFEARLVKCDDSTPTSGTTDGSTSADGLAACSGAALAAAGTESDQMVGITQAFCATSGGDCSISTDFSQTLSSSVSSGGAGTTTDTVNGQATFTGLQAHYTFGAGFLVRFVFDPILMSSSGIAGTGYGASGLSVSNGAVPRTTATLTTVHTHLNGQVFLPDLGDGVGGSVTADHTNFIIRPYALEVVQHPGGDGVDIDGLSSPVAGDGTVNTPDGVGASQPFRVQPAVVVKGMGASSEYYFSTNWGKHGHMPITAAINTEMCGQDCVTKELVLTGNTTTVSLTKKTATPLVLTGTDDAVATYSGDPGSIDTEMTYTTILGASGDATTGMVGYYWRDLMINTRDSDTGYESLKLRFICGYNTNLWQQYLNNSASPYTVVDSGYFDVFTAPSTPLNLRAEAYGVNGFRINFEASVIARLKPLSGFILEVRKCSTSSGSCSTSAVTQFEPALQIPDRTLGSDYYSGGGRTEEVFFTYSQTEPAVATAVNISFYPSAHIYGGDQIVIMNRYPGLKQSTDFSGDCTLEGTHGPMFTISITDDNMTLTAADTTLVPRKSPVLIVIPATCLLIYPDLLEYDAQVANMNATREPAAQADYQSSRYGSHPIAPPARSYAYIIGSVNATTGDNCKGGCSVTTTHRLPIMQDGNSMDLAWDGSMRFSAVGVPCAPFIGSPEDTATQVFPSKRYCSMASTGSNDLDAYDDVTDNPFNIYVTSNHGNSGQNGKPIGTNAGRIGYATGYPGPSRTVSSGTAFSDSSSACRAGTSAQNPCVLPSGEDWNNAVTMNYTIDSSAVTSVQVRIIRDGCLFQGASFAIAIPGSQNSAGSASVACSAAGETLGALSGWSCAWTQSTGYGSLVVTVGSTVCTGEAITITADPSTLSLNSTLTADSAWPMKLTAVFKTGTQQQTVIIRDQASTVTFNTLSGDPVGNYADSATKVSIATGDIFTFRAYAFNGRFRSPAAETPVQTRAIDKPVPPAYFPDVAHNSVGAQLTYSQTGATNGTLVASTATEITVKVTPPADLPNATTLTIGLRGFTSSTIKRDIATGHDVFTVAHWNSNTSSLVLVVAPGTVALQAVPYTIVIPESADILYPATGEAAAGAIARISKLTITFVSPFPTATQPRAGFVVQMSTDRNWNSDISSIQVSDQINDGIMGPMRIGYIQADVDATQLNVTLADPGSGPTHDWLLLGYIQVDLEVMKVTGASAGVLTVIRGQLGTAAAAHAQVTGAGTCACAADGTASGTGANSVDCGCTHVSVVYNGAANRNLGRYNGFDKLIGTAGAVPADGSDGCKIGSIYWPFGCNVRVPPVSFASGVRSFQSIEVATGMLESHWLTNCGSSTDKCSGNCACTTPSSRASTDIGRPTRTAEPIHIRSTGDPLEWPNLALGGSVLDNEVATATEQYFVLTDASIVASSYLRIDDEIVYVHGPRKRGVKGVNLYTSSGNPDDASIPCSCNMTGVAAGGGTCSCFPQAVMTGCTAGGTLRAVGGNGRGFSATFEVESGYISSITVTNPGYGYISIPTITISDGGTGCTFAAGQSFVAVTSSEVVSVERGALGTTAVNHSAGTYVSMITWPLRGTVNVPGPQYYFRVAAYNDAGLSAWRYYRQAIVNMNPNLLPTIGGQTIEITMEGGGHTKDNTTVYIGHTLRNGSIDFSRSKLCESLVISDIAGTRITCVTPAWVGKRHDVMVRYKSGDIDRVSIGNGYANFPAPTVKVVQPVQVTAGVPATITVTGTNFGKNKTDVIGVLVTATGEIRCEPLNLLSDSSLTCGLKPKAGMTFNGNIRIGVGTTWSGGQQNSSATGVESKVKEFDPPAEVELTLAKDITTIPEGSPERITFVAAVANDIASAAKVPPSRVNVTSLRAGSLVVVFVILPDPDSATTSTPAQVAALIATQAADPTSPLLSGATTSAVTGVSVPASVLEAAAEASGTTISTSTTPGTPPPIMKPGKFYMLSPTRFGV